MRSLPRIQQVLAHPKMFSWVILASRGLGLARPGMEHPDPRFLGPVAEARGKEIPPGACLSGVPLLWVPVEGMGDPLRGPPLVLNTILSPTASASPAPHPGVCRGGPGPEAGAGCELWGWGAGLPAGAAPGSSAHGADSRFRPAGTATCGIWSTCSSTAPTWGPRTPRGTPPCMSAPSTTRSVSRHAPHTLRDCAPGAGAVPSAVQG